MRRGGGSITSAISARAPRAPISLSGPDQPCPSAPPTMGPGAHFGSAHRTCLSCMGGGPVSSWAVDMSMPPSALPWHCGPLGPSLGLILTLNYTSTSWLDFGPASSLWHCLMAWTLVGPGHHLRVCPACLVSAGTPVHLLSHGEQPCSCCSLATSK